MVRTRNQSQQREPHLDTTLLIAATLVRSPGRSAASELGLGVSSPASSNLRGEHFFFFNLISFLGKLRLCARDVSLLQGAFYLFVFVCFQKGFGSQLSRQGAPEISQGSLKAGGQRPLTLPLR